MRGHAHTVNVLLLQLQVGVDEVVAEHATAGQELAIRIQSGQGFVQRAGHGRHFGSLFRRQIIQVLVHGIARMDLVDDAVQTGHQLGSEGQVRVGSRIREADFNAARFRARYHRDTDGGRAVAGGVGQHDRCFITRNQTLVGVGGRVGEGVDGLGVLDDAADVVQRHLGQTAVQVAGEQVDAVLGQRLVAVHAGAVVAEHGFRHEGDGLVVGVGHVVDHVLQHLYFVSLQGEGVEAGGDLVLTGSGHFVVVSLNDLAHLFQHQTHGGADILGGVDRGNREVTALHERTVAFVAVLVVGTGVPGGFFGFDLHEAVTHGVREGDVVEHEEFRLWPEQHGVGDTAGFQEVFGTLGDGARIAVVTLHGSGFQHVTDDVQSGLFGERVQLGRGRIRHQHHVGFVDAFPAADGGAVEHLAVFEEIFVDLVGRDGYVLLFTLGIGKAQVDKLDFVFLDQGQNVLG